MERQAHYVVEAAVDTCYGCSPYPFLYAIRPGFVERAVYAYVTADLVVGKMTERYLRRFRERVESFAFS